MPWANANQVILLAQQFGYYTVVFKHYLNLINVIIFFLFMGDIIEGVDEDEILFWPPGDVNKKCLESLLTSAGFEELKDSDKMEYYRSRRIKNFDHYHPAWENIKERMSVGRLKRLYKNTTGHDFDFEQYKCPVGRVQVVLCYDERTGSTFVAKVGD
jgi:hypothetical protein